MHVTMILGGWKEIAQYLRCGVRSAQRWQSLGLPVKRLHWGSRATVVADSEKIDRWVHGGKDLDTPSKVTRNRELQAQVRRFSENLRQLKKTMDLLKVKKR